MLVFRILFSVSSVIFNLVIILVFWVISDVVVVVLVGIVVNVVIFGLYWRFLLSLCVIVV